MSFRRAVEMTGTSILLFATAALIATSGCSGGGTSSGTGGAPGTGGNKGIGGHVGAGGMNGTAGAGMGGGAVMPTCTPIAADANNPVIDDFSNGTTNFGDGTTTVSGTLLQFNGAAPDLGTGAWVIDQDVTGYGDSGVGIDFQSCPESDMSAFTGLAFDIAGVITAAASTPADGGVPAQRVSFQVSTAEDDVASNYDSQSNFAPSFGQCVPVSGNQYDNTCTTPQVNVPIAAGPTLVTKSFLWSQITGGKGMPNGRATPNPAKITHLRWIFPFDGMTPFHIKLTIDNVRGLTAGGTPDSGTPPPPPADAATDAPTD